ncbi:hypothetical protein [Acaryochloris sp. CCMEE 5410]|uniref:hypothetical protein n=1 Tax=Acaryochloris sp. CCMEE 5410 TaxID=310037 RepID=UPI0002483A6E|nr:hypothetical protein [Acaryochloris sp. CCMEE 5410]KAI9129433.1 hypothetical protein ON05_035590 [Acaryochloris sp. CCMEE 5410]
MDCAATRTPEEREFLRMKGRDMAFGYIQMARHRPRPEEIANMALADWGQGNIFNGVVDQLGLIWEDVDGKIIYRKNLQRELEKEQALDRYRCASKEPPFTKYPDLLDMSLELLLNELESWHKIGGLDERYDSCRVEALVWMLCYHIASVMEEDHCILLEMAAYAIAYRRKTDPTASPEWKDCGMAMCDRVLGSIYTKPE